MSKEYPNLICCIFSIFYLYEGNFLNKIFNALTFHLIGLLNKQARQGCFNSTRFRYEFKMNIFTHYMVFKN